MTSLVTNLIFKRIFSETVSNSQGTSDPYFEYVPTKKLASFSRNPKTKLKKRKKALPPGLSPEDEKVLVKVKRRAYRLDMALGSFMGMKLGYGSLIAFLPVVGDFADLLLALMVIRTASACQLPLMVLLRMLVNVAFDFVIGLVPFLGDIADMAYKANTRNAVVLEDFLRERGRANMEAAGRGFVEDLSLEEVEVERGVTERGEAARGSGGRRREWDVESQRGGPTVPAQAARGQARGQAVRGAEVGGSGKRHKGKKQKGHARLYSLETGTTAR